LTRNRIAGDRTLKNHVVAGPGREALSADTRLPHRVIDRTQIDYLPYTPVKGLPTLKGRNGYIGHNPEFLLAQRTKQPHIQLQPQ
jgi:hypothetical protein